MTSQELKAAKQTLISNVNNYINNYNNLYAKMDVINNCFTNNTDTILNNELLQNSSKISSKITEAINEINAKKNEAIIKIDAEIQRLEEYERQQLLAKQKEEQQEGE